MNRAIVTGGAGFIGSHLVDELISFGIDVAVIDNLSLGRRKNVNPRAKLYENDITGDFCSLEKLFEGVDCVFHLAAQPRIQPSIKNPLFSFKHNVLGTMNVLEAARLHRVKGFVFSGSSSVYGDQDSLPLREDMIPGPKNPYAECKYQAERWCLHYYHLYDLPVVCLRYFNVFGERQSTEGAYATVVGIFLRQRKNGEPLTIVPDGSQRRDFTYVRDVVMANVLAMCNNQAVGQVINIGTGTNYSVKEVADMISEEQVLIEPRSGEAKETLADNSKARQIIGWEPKVSLENWAKKHLKK